MNSFFSVKNDQDGRRAPQNDPHADPIENMDESAAYKKTEKTADGNVAGENRFIRQIETAEARGNKNEERHPNEAPHLKRGGLSLKRKNRLARAPDDQNPRGDAQQLIENVAQETSEISAQIRGALEGPGSAASHADRIERRISGMKTCRAPSPKKRPAASQRMPAISRRNFSRRGAIP